MRAIYIKELRSYFSTITGYVFIAAFILSTALFFTVNNVLMNSDSLSNVLLSNCYVMILIVPPLTMRLFAEERKNNTQQLWMSAPIRLYKVVLAKYLAAATVFAAALVVSLSFAGVLAFLGEGFYFGEAAIGYLGCAMVCLCLISLGMFMSALFENQLSCAIATAVAILALYLADAMGYGIAIDGLSDIIRAVTPYYHLRLFRIGLLLPGSVARLFSFAAVFALLTLVALDARVTKRQSTRAKGER